MNRSLGLLVGFVFFCGSIALAGVAYKCVHFWMTGPDSNGGPSKNIFYEVKARENPKTIARELAQAGVISNASFFYWYGRLTGKSQKFKAGDYRFTNHMRPDEVMAVIMSGISYGVQMVVPEGYSMAQISDVIEALRPGSGERFLKLCHDMKFIATLGFAPAPSSLEGYLYPDTYLVGRKTPEEEVIRSMIRKYRGVFTTELEDRAKAIGMTPHQVVTLASIIEKETGAKEERPMISSVFHNRLKKHMRLQTDPTVIYGIKNYQGNITRKDLETPTPYNTYTIPALPPGPIASPGREAILAALYPSETEYLFFVSHNDGTHEFTTNFDDHKKAVSKFQLNPKAREGKSWRDLRKRDSAAKAAQ